jgi:hypothetical protein
LAIESTYATTSAWFCPVTIAAGMIPPPRSIAVAISSSSSPLSTRAGPVPPVPSRPWQPAHGPALGPAEEHWLVARRRLEDRPLR